KGMSTPMHLTRSPCCALAASGHAAAAPPTSVMNSRRLMPDMGLPPPSRSKSSATADPCGHSASTLSLPREATLWVAFEHRLIEGADINRAVHEPDSRHCCSKIK